MNEESFFDNGGKLIIKKAKDGGMFIVIEIKIKGEKYHCGIPFKSFDKLISGIKNTVNASVEAVARLQDRLKKT